MKHLQKTLQAIALTPGESRVYLSLLPLGQVSTGQIIKNTTVSRSKVYEILDRLHKKGIVSKIKNDQTTLYLAQPPQKIKQLLTEKQNELENRKKELEKILPLLTKTYQNKIPKTSAQIFLGYNGIKSAFENIIENPNPKEEYLAFSIVDVPAQFDGYLRHWHKTLAQNKIKTRAIFNETANKETIKKYSNNSLIKIKIISKEFNSPAVFNIYKDQTAIIVWAKEPLAILIKNQEITDSFKKYFKIIWDFSK